MSVSNNTTTSRGRLRLTIWLSIVLISVCIGTFAAAVADQMRIFAFGSAESIVMVARVTAACMLFAAFIYAVSRVAIHGFGFRS